MFFNNSTAHSLEEISQLFANHCSSVYSLNKIADYILESLNVNMHDININSMNISENEISDYLISIDDKSSTGPDGISPIFLKKCFLVLVNLLHYLFNLSLSLGVFPAFWKKSFITPIHKSGSKNDICNYRPISKLSAIPKLFEAIISKKTVQYIIELY